MKGFNQRVVIGRSPTCNHSPQLNENEHIANSVSFIYPLRDSQHRRFSAVYLHIKYITVHDVSPDFLLTCMYKSKSKS
jgi:hypothetical protein